MAVAPLFVDTMDNLKKSLKLSGAVSTDTLAAIDLAVKKVRIGFHKALGTTRVLQLVALTPSENPTTENEILRSTAEACEVTWVKMLLMQDLATVFMDGSGNTQQIWNQEGLLRDASPSTIKDMIFAMLSHIEEMLDFLGGEDETSSLINVSAIGPTEANQVPGYATGVFHPLLTQGWYITNE